MGRAAPAAIALRGSGHYDRMALRHAQFCIKADLPAMIDKPFGAGDQIFFVLWLRGNAGDFKKFRKFRDESRPVLFEIVEDGLHKNLAGAAIHTVSSPAPAVTPSSRWAREK